MALLSKEAGLIPEIAARTGEVLARLRASLAGTGLELQTSRREQTDIVGLVSLGSVEVARLELVAQASVYGLNVYPPSPDSTSLLGHWPRTHWAYPEDTEAVVDEFEETFRGCLVAHGVLAEREFPTTRRALDFVRDLAGTAASSTDGRKAVAKAVAILAKRTGTAGRRKSALDLLHACADSRPETVEGRADAGFVKAVRQARGIRSDRLERAVSNWRRQSHVGWLLDPPALEAAPGPKP